MLDRILGLETEYAIRFTPAHGARRPGNHVIFEALSASIQDVVITRPGEQRAGEHGRIFTQSGASISYERLPSAPDGGLVEAGTPECRGPSQLLCHQKALDALLVEALPGCADRLSEQGHPGDVGLLKNCRDAEGHTYGAQENYEAEVARGAGLAAYRAALVLSTPLLVVYVVLNWVLGLALLALGIVIGILALFVALLIPSVRRSGAIERLFDPADVRVARWLWYALSPLSRGLFHPIAAIACLPLRLAFRRQRRAMLGFLVSRPILTGAGTVLEDGHFGLSEKGPSIRRVLRFTVDSEQRPLFDTGNLMKDLLSPSRLRARPFLHLFRTRQRMQLGLSDSNVAQVAEYLKIGATALVLDMAEAGLLDDAPRPAEPIAALHALVADPTLAAKVPIEGEPSMTALALQRHYLACAREFVRKSKATSMEAHQIVRLWEEALDGLAADPGKLVGCLDWVSKRYLLEACGRDAPWAVQKKLDLRYHELGGGYLARMERSGLARRLVSDAEIAEAVRTPPGSTPAKLRGTLIRRLARSDLPIRVSWDSVRIGGRIRGKVIRLGK